MFGALQDIQSMVRSRAMWINGAEVSVYIIDLFITLNPRSLSNNIYIFDIVFYYKVIIPGLMRDIFLFMTKCLS